MFAESQLLTTPAGENKEVRETLSKSGFAQIGQYVLMTCTDVPRATLIEVHLKFVR